MGIFLQHRLRKEERCSNWERVPLSTEQIEYAATDAYAALMVLLAMRKTLGTGSPLVSERILSGPQNKELCTHTPIVPSPVRVGDGPLQQLTSNCVRRGFLLKPEGFESAPGGFRAVFRITTSARQYIFRSNVAHASIREAQNDAASCALEALESWT